MFPNGGDENGRWRAGLELFCAGDPDIDGKIDSTLYVWPNQWEGKYKYWVPAANDFSLSSTAGVTFQHTK
ncbi:MAG: hypothetical protein IH628_15715, partial [Proteobacteria bacterium]|nr:hypothetical protein [Pseudomonadota bacterium]